MILNLLPAFIVIAVAFFALGFIFGFKKGEKYINRTAVIDAVVDISAKEIIQDEKKKSENKHFSIEHYPLSNRYYPKYKDNYLQKKSSTGVIGVASFFEYSDHFTNEQDARSYIEKAKEHMLKTNVVTIQM